MLKPLWFAYKPDDVLAAECEPKPHSTLDMMKRFLLSELFNLASERNKTSKCRQKIASRCVATGSSFDKETWI